MSDDYLIRARGLTKTYRMHKRPSARLLGLFGKEKDTRELAPGEVYQALRGIDLDIKRGEKVAIIGRNGAGKSTLLKIITGVIKPTTGSIDVRGKSHALLSLGAGFHPDFTGRENAHAFLAHMGVSGRKADELVETVIDFAEIEEHIDQPLKTYSTGMQARLMFAVSTALDPELLVIDEVLGVGDAYFQHKSFERIREMCDGGNTTLLLVSHDIYSAVKLCPRVIWVDKGRVLIDSDPATVLRAYEDSVREQEEQRLRQKALKAVGNRKARTERVLVEIQSPGNQAPKAQVWFSEISLKVNGTRVASLPLGDDAFEGSNGARLLREGSNWSAPETVNGKLARAINTHGSSMHKVSGIFEVADSAGTLRAADLSAVVEYTSASPVELAVSLVTADRTVPAGMLPSAAETWRTHLAGAVSKPETPHQDETGTPSSLDWETWSGSPEGLQKSVSETVLQLEWHGAAGPYLLVSEEQVLAPHQAHLIPMNFAIESGTLGIGALDASGQWARTYTFHPGSGGEVLEIPTGETGRFQLVIYSAGEAPLKARLELRGQSLNTEADAGVNTTGIYGAGDIRSEGFRIFGADDTETFVLDLARPARFEIDYRIIRPNLREKAHVLLAFQRDGVLDILRVIQKDFLFDQAAADTGTLSIGFDPLPLAAGTYTIALVIGAEGYFDRKQELYFAINPDAYFVQSSVAEIKVVGTNPVHDGTGVVIDAEWTMTPSGAPAQGRQRVIQ